MLETKDQDGLHGEMNLKINNFEENIEFGEKYEDKFKKKLEKIFMILQIDSIRFADNPELQKAGIDLKIFSEQSNIDVKVRSKFANNYCYNKDILLEEKTSIKNKTNLNSGRPGWLYTIKNGLVAYCWENIHGTNLESIGYFLIINDSFRDWFEKNKHLFLIPNFSVSKDELGRYWYTQNRIIPIGSYPKNYILKFNPKLTLDYFTEQTKLLE